MLEVFNWIKENWQSVLQIYGGVVAICTVIVKLTPTTKDDTIFNSIIKFIDCFSTAFTKNDKEKLNK